MPPAAAESLVADPTRCMARPRSAFARKTPTTTSKSTSAPTGGRCRLLRRPSHHPARSPRCLTKTPVNPIPFAKPSGGLLFRPIANLLNGRTESGRLARPLYPGGLAAVRRYVHEEQLYSVQGLVYPLIGRIGALSVLRPRRPSSERDPVGISCWSPDTHHVRRLVKDGAVYCQGKVEMGSSALLVQDSR